MTIILPRKSLLQLSTLHSDHGATRGNTFRTRTTVLDFLSRAHGTRKSLRNSASATKPCIPTSAAYEKLQVRTRTERWPNSSSLTGLDQFPLFPGFSHLPRVTKWTLATESRSLVFLVPSLVCRNAEFVCKSKASSAAAAANKKSWSRSYETLIKRLVSLGGRE